MSLSSPAAAAAPSRLQCAVGFVWRRLHEPSSWAAIAAVSGALAAQLPVHAKPFLVAAAVASTLGGILLKERGGR